MNRLIRSRPMRAEDGGMAADDENRELANPYGARGRGGSGSAGRGGTLRRWVIVIMALAVTLALVVGTVGSSCAAPPREAQGSVTGLPGR